MLLVVVVVVVVVVMAVAWRWFFFSSFPTVFSFLLYPSPSYQVIFVFPCRRWRLTRSLSHSVELFSFIFLNGLDRVIPTVVCLMADPPQKRTYGQWRHTGEEPPKTTLRRMRTATELEVEPGGDPLSSFFLLFFPSYSFSFFLFFLADAKIIDFKSL